MEREKCRNLRILLGESLVELFDFIEEDLQLVGRWQDGHSGQEEQRKGKHKLTLVMQKTADGPAESSLDFQNPRIPY